MALGCGDRLGHEMLVLITAMRWWRFVHMARCTMRGRMWVEKGSKLHKIRSVPEEASI